MTVSTTLSSAPQTNGPAAARSSSHSFTRALCFRFDSRTSAITCAQPPSKLPDVRRERRAFGRTAEVMRLSFCLYGSGFLIGTVVDLRFMKTCRFGGVSGGRLVRRDRLGLCPQRSEESASASVAGNAELGRTSCPCRARWSPP